MADIKDVIEPEFRNAGGWTPESLGAQEANAKVEELQKQLAVDPLTGLESEYPLKDMINGLQSRWEKDYRKGEFLKGTFIVADLTNLHGVNDTFGKSSGGDSYVIAVADALKEISRENGRCFRERDSADEFVLYLPGFKIKKEIESILDQIDEKLEESEKGYQKKYPGIKFELSYTIATFHRAYAPKDAYEDANNAMGKAKDAKKERGGVGRIFLSELKHSNKQYE